jgi:methionyl-tRNA formyltransferase
LITKSTLAIGVGEVWRFDTKTIEKFEGRLLDFMGIPLPRYRGGAHYSWMILKKDRVGGCNLQLINKDMIQGVFDSGEIVKSKKYSFPASVKIPQDYFDFTVMTELEFLKDFLRQVEKGQAFKLKKLDESLSMYFPRLYTLKHGFINWNWSTEDIVTFICAFDQPYKGASTFVNGKRIFLKNCCAAYDEGGFHPFQSGLIYRKQANALFVATANGTLIIKQVTDGSGKDILPLFKVGERLFTPEENLKESMSFNAEYNSAGIV